jgi:hypothetical protein
MAHNFIFYIAVNACSSWNIYIGKISLQKMPVTAPQIPMSCACLDSLGSIITRRIVVILLQLSPKNSNACVASLGMLILHKNNPIC